ncbi:hypothetical protein [Tepidibacter aestuarii]|uniref:hypothetical protein n=1 Tax=Tepidibacter aestuarii TaxID=2925782 RepID=UPI0020C1546C|nr:hypothetical protein [Tepidibacter aestuarii]CAH2212246.1 membrane protein of unknown function [Tepidibacter aestuarii]
MEVFINILATFAVIMLFVASYKAFKHKTIVFLKRNQEIQNLEEACRCFGKLYFFGGIINLIYILLSLFFPEEEISFRIIIDILMIIFLLCSAVFRDKYIKKTKPTKID